MKKIKYHHKAFFTFDIPVTALLLIILTILSIHLLTIIKKEELFNKNKVVELIRKMDGIKQ